MIDSVSGRGRVGSGRVGSGWVGSGRVGSGGIGWGEKMCLMTVRRQKARNGHGRQGVFSIITVLHPIDYRH